MIALDFIQETPASATGLIVEPASEKSEGTLSFSALLESLKKGDDTSVLKELLQDLKDNSKNSEVTFTDLLKGSKEESKGEKNSTKDTLLSLLNNDDAVVDKELLELNPQLKKSLSSEDFKLLIKDAKSYLKNQILSTEGFKRSEIEMLPKTLKGLTQVAQKLGIDLSKITLEEVQQSQPDKKALNLDKDKMLADESKKSAKKDNTLLANKSELINKSEENKNISDEVLSKQPKKSKINLTNTKTEVSAVKENNELHSDDVKVQRQVKAEQKTLNHELKSTPLFKAQSSTEISTEQMVSVKSSQTNPNELNKPKKRADDTLKLLLQGEKSVKKEGLNLTSDFSVATAKVIAPSAKSEVTQSLETLLRPDTITNDDISDTSTSSKTDTVQVAKADSFEVKINEAKQMIKYLSQDVKQAIDNYKSPFTRVKVQLNPQQLGEVELTVVQRGKNLHVNLSSNNAAINTLAMNANDLKMQLQNSGINNASLNFSNNSQGGEAANGGQSNQQQQDRQQARDEYNYFIDEEKNEEILSSLEIIVPNYA